MIVNPRKGSHQGGVLSMWCKETFNCERKLIGTCYVPLIGKYRKSFDNMLLPAVIVNVYSPTEFKIKFSL